MTNQTPAVDVDAFFDDLFGKEVVDAGGVRVASFRDMSAASWYGRTWHRGDVVDPLANNYFSIGELSKDAPRVIGNLLAHHLIIADDVGTKVDGDKLLDAMGVAPSYKLETSPGNQTWIWKLAVAGGVPVSDTDECLVYAVREYMKTHGLTDPGSADAVRYIRFAPGQNTKEGYLNPLTGDYPSVRLVEWNEDVPGLFLGDLCERFYGPDWEQIVRSGSFATMADMERLHGAGVSGSASWSDPLVRLAQEIGLNPRAGSGSGKIDADCPNMAAHSQREETGFAFLGRGLMKCHHGECAGLHVGDMRRLMCESYEAQVEVGLALGTWPKDAPTTGENFLAKCAFEGAGAGAGAGAGLGVVGGFGVGSGADEDVSRTVERLMGVVKSMLGAGDLAELNDRYCLVSNISGVIDREPAGGGVLEVVPFYTFRTFQDGRAKIAVPGKRGGIGLGSAWLDSVNAPRFNRIGLWDEVKEGKPAPADMLNLFDGGLSRFADASVRAKSGKPTLAEEGAANGSLDYVLGFIRDVICGGDVSVDPVTNVSVQGLANEWVLNWLAWGYQNPLEKPGTNLVLIGNQGTGKGTLGRMMLELFGDFALHVTQSDHLLGRFSGHLEGKLFCFIDEAMFGKDPRTSGVYKARTTEAEMLVEHKGQTPRRVKNHMKLLIASNHLDAAPIEPGDRRSTVLEVADAWRGNVGAWTKFWEAWRKLGGKEAFARYLLDRDVSGFNEKACFGTDAKEDMADATGDLVTAFWRDFLDAGRAFPVGVVPLKLAKDSVTGQDEFPDWNTSSITVQAQGVRAAFEDWLKTQKHAHRVSPVEMHHSLGRLCPGRTKMGSKPSIGGLQDRCYVFPPLPDCLAQAKAAKKG